MICGKRWAIFGYQLRAAFRVDHFGSIMPASFSWASASDARTSALPISTSTMSSAMSSWMCWKPSMPIESASSDARPRKNSLLAMVRVTTWWVISAPAPVSE